MPYQNRSPMQQQNSLNYGSTPHLSQQQQQLFQANSYVGGGGGGFTMRSAPNPREFPPNQSVDEQGRYMSPQQPAPGLQQQYNRESSPYQVHRTNSYNPMMGNNNNGGYLDSYGMGDTGYQSSGPLPIQLHKNFLSRENLNQVPHPQQQVYYGNASIDHYPAQPPPQQQFYLHDQSAGNGSPPVAPQRRTWAQSAAQQKQMSVESSWSSPQTSSPNAMINNNGNQGGGGFMLHQNGADSESFLNKSGNLFPVHTSSPQHNRVHRQISQMIDESTRVAAEHVPSSLTRVCICYLLNSCNYLLTMFVEVI